MEILASPGPDEVKRICLELLVEVDRICKKQKIKYFIYGGTLLGAVRHRGFIPWDDDIDIVMFRDDYTRFIDICKTELNNKCFLETIESEPFSIVTWGKLHKRDTAFIHDNVPKECFQGISIDLFAFDKVPENNFTRSLFGFLHDKFNFLYSQRFAEKVKKPSYRRRALNLLISLTKIVPDLKLKKWYQRLSTRYNNRDYQYVIHNSFRRFKQKLMPVVFFEETCLLEFEGYLFSAPQRWHEVLKRYYGENYMQLPPEEERFIHHASVIDPYNSWQAYTGN